MFSAFASGSWSLVYMRVTAFIHENDFILLYAKPGHPVYTNIDPI